jgi:hypothetical protein
MTLYVRIFQFVHIRLVPLWCTYYICSLFQYIYMVMLLFRTWFDQLHSVMIRKVFISFIGLYNTAGCQFLTRLGGREKMHTQSAGPHAPIVRSAVYSQSMLKYEDFMRMWLYFFLLNRVSIFPVPPVYKWDWTSINAADGDKFFLEDWYIKCYVNTFLFFFPHFKH